MGGLPSSSRCTFPSQEDYPKTNTISPHQIKKQFCACIWQVNANFSCTWLFALLWHPASNRLWSASCSAADTTSGARLSPSVSATYLEDTRSALMAYEPFVGFLPHFSFDVQRKYCGGKATQAMEKRVFVHDTVLHFYLTGGLNSGRNNC